MNDVVGIELIHASNRLYQRFPTCGTQPLGVRGTNIDYKEFIRIVQLKTHKKFIVLDYKLVSCVTPIVYSSQNDGKCSLYLEIHL